MRPTYTLENLAKAITKSDSWRKVCAELGLFYCQQALKRLKAKADAASLSYEHFLGKATWKNKVSPLRKPATELKGNSHSRRLALIRDGIKEHRCEVCTLTEWMGKPIPLTLHHVDGNKLNNKLDNLKIVCGNCHMQTENFGIKNPMRYASLLQEQRASS